MKRDEVTEYLKQCATPVLFRDLNPDLQTLSPGVDSETVVGFYLAEDEYYIDN